MLAVVVLVIIDLVFVIACVFRGDIRRDLGAADGRLSLIFSKFRDSDSASFATSTHSCIRGFSGGRRVRILMVGSSNEIIVASAKFAPSSGRRVPSFGSTLSGRGNYTC